MTVPQEKEISVVVDKLHHKELTSISVLIDSKKNMQPDIL